jgi:ubiquinol-cytochrome c reductase cytochrome c1 subunit
MFRKIALTAVSALAVMVGTANAAGVEGHVEDVDFAHEGPFGKFDEFQVQRGLQVYTEVCSGCHGLKFVPIRSLADEGGPHLPGDQVRAYAASLDSVVLANGDERPREWTDKFPIRAGDGMGPDLSLMAKARAGFHGPYGSGINQMFKGMGGPEYIYSILTGYTGEEKEEAGSFFYENKAFPGGWIAMGPPLSDDQVTYADGHPATVHHMAEDVASFLMWTAEPHLVARKQAGFVAVTMLLLLSVLLYLTNKKLWASVKGKEFHA